jgi:hypothetical protein
MSLGHVESLAPLALLALRETAAAGYAIHRFDGNGAICLSAYGLSLAEGREEGLLVAQFSLRVEAIEVGTLSFVFRGRGIPENAGAVLERLARTIESVWLLSYIPDTLIQLATRIGRLQAELADLKIADRARSFLAHPEPNSTGILASHVESVLQARRLEAQLQQLVGELENQIHERKLISEAKSLLQRSYGLTEEAAYARLRVTSHRSRRRLGDVAQQVIERKYDAHST